MKFEAYLAYFEDILHNPAAHAAYQDEEYFHYTKMNWSRMSRWLKKFEPSAEAKAFFGTITTKQHWILITEPWCGDAAHSVPMIYKMVKDNPNIELDIQLRDTAPFLIEQYLTNGGKSVPKLVIRNEAGEDLAVWGPRPDGCTAVFMQMKAKGAEFEEIKEEIQKWYNQDKGEEIQGELIKLLS
ncbi:hypothetical protein HMPREF0765_0611 [Sphingobacterium spiritivorum ATCC 33300]|uniref:Thioredoxin n=1 Tax=Sphingobacterium spiritivorum ATCC 33300 TaxID=525372 RepID=C2FTF5_SPHSI|nr:thioredoxin family protein [Sphingobacterium spiritivorum]EEI93758.1 hypothetical protein HMPREF0765_0611 [Sphingobacterium spiritivorum ATCC 33300]QQS98183.1 thioredoxin family protein [Sphingobacterium spiritivorum]